MSVAQQQNENNFASAPHLTQFRGIIGAVASVIKREEDLNQLWDRFSRLHSRSPLAENWEDDYPKWQFDAEENSLTAKVYLKKRNGKIQSNRSQAHFYEFLQNGK